ncbi:hypothetical protein MMC20_007332 [Loxospora ochrophaea]|nr:hypothetical protein [Loxospora ochrophaea]
MAPSTKSQKPTKEDSNCHFTVFIRVPFPRGDFVDPPPTNWDSSKDKTLWKVLSRASKGSEIDWHALADQLDVSLPFLLQQAAWLYERQLSQVRAQLRKVNRPSSTGPPPAPGSNSGSAGVGGYAMKRGGSGGSRVPSALSVRARESPNPKNEGSTPSTPVQTRGPGISRTSSTNTVHKVQKQVTPVAHNNPQEETQESQKLSEVSSKPRRRSVVSPPTASPTIADSSSETSSSESDSPAPISRSRIFTRRPRFSAPKAALGPLSDADEDEDSSPTFLPFSDSKANSPQPQPKPTMNPNPILIRQHHNQRPSLSSPSSRSAQAQPAHSPSSSTSSAHPPSSQRSQASVNALSPRGHKTFSPRQKRIAREGESEGTPSMGSSFSDLDDASVTQSALEEALAREMGHGGGVGVASRMSTISQALRSRYL